MTMPWEILIAGLMVFVAFRLFSARNSERRDQDRDYGDDRDDTNNARDDANDDSDASRPRPAGRQATDVYQRAQSTWDMLSSDKKNADASSRGTSAAVDSGGSGGADAFDEDDFLNGAKAVYNRVKESWYDRDLEDIEQFTEKAFFKILRKRAAEEPRQGKAVILLVQAQLMDHTQSADLEQAKVFYETQLQDSASGGARQVQEIWLFRRDKKTAAPEWLIADMEIVEDSVHVKQ